MDIVALPGVDVVHNLLEFPWPYPADSFDHAYLSHVMEHVPHFLGGKHTKDGFILVMEELHRILKPGGTAEIRCPHPESVDRWVDPTHTRIVHPRNFEYFGHEAALNYYTSARFNTVVAEVTLRSAVLQNFLPMGKKKLGLTTHLAERLPFMKPLLYRKPYELRVVVEKTPASYASP